jgi:ATP-dependent helicase/nuclease subunit A
MPLKPQPIDYKERERLVEDLETSFCVEAAAGTGKTTLLVGRILSIISSGKAQLEQVVAITFTEKAAGELKIRLRESLEKSLTLNGEPVKGRLELALEQLDRANVSTIHAFAAALLRERPIEAGIDPGFEQLDEMGSDLLFEEVWQKWKEKQYEANAPTLRRVLNLEIKLESAVKPIARQLFENRDVALTMPEGACELRIGELWKSLRAEVRQLERLQAQCVDPDDRGYLQIQQLRTLFERGEKGNDQDKERIICQDLDVGLKGARKNWKTTEACDSQKAICKVLQVQVEDARTRIGHSVAADILNWLKDFLRDLEAEKHARGLLDFQDLLLKARDLVRDNRDVRQYFQERFRYLVVDEFQDTDPLQAELIFYLSEKGPSAANWKQVRPAPGKLFLVGDPKQSIYRFRRADIEIYKEAKGILARTGEVVPIRQNFRSTKSVIAGVNRLFKPQMNGQYQADYVELVEQAERPESGPGLMLLYPSNDYAPSNMEAYRQAEADLIARFVRKAVGQFEAWEKSKKEFHKARFRDLAVLFPVTTSIAEYQEALAGAEIPYRFDSGRQFYERAEIRALIAVLRAIENPADSVAVVAALRSPFFGFSDEDIFLFKHSGGSFNYLRTFDEGVGQVKPGMEQLRKWHDGLSKLSLPALVEKVLDESHVLPFYLLTPNGEQAVANLLRIVELARAFEFQTVATLRGFVRWLEEREASELAEAEGVLAEEEDDAVQLMTVHAAKGLEFPIVVLANFGCQANQRRPFLVDHGQRRVSIAIGSRERGIRTADHEEMSQRDAQRASAEDLRLLYVATTRARDYLAIPLVETNSGDKARFSRYFMPLWLSAPTDNHAVHEDGAFKLPAAALPLQEVRQVVFRRNIGQRAVPPDELTPLLDQRREWREALATLGVGVEPVQPETAHQQWKFDRAWAARRGTGTAASVGTAFHRIMQHLQLADDPMLESLIEQATIAEGIPDEQDTLRQVVVATLKHPLIERARKAGRIWRELPFSLSEQGELREGYIDLLFEEPSGLVLVDYKTDDIEPAKLHGAVSHYATQAGLYMRAVEQITQQRPKEVLLFFVRLGIVHSVSTVP